MASILSRGSSFLVVVVLAIMAAVVGAQAPAQFEFALPAQPLADSLRAVGRVAHVNVAFDPPTVAGRLAQSLRGRFSAEEALERLLRGSGLRLRVTDGGSFWIDAASVPEK